MRKWLAEPVAKMAIYLLSTLSLFAFLLFVRSARGYSAATMAAEVGAQMEAPLQQMADAGRPVADEVAGVAETTLPQQLPAPRAAAATQAAGAAKEPTPAPEEPAPVQLSAKEGLRAMAPFAVEEPVSAAALHALAAPAAYAVEEGAGSDLSLHSAMPLDMNALQAELERLRGMGFDLAFNEARPEYVGVYYATSYCCEAYKHICGGNGVTASGTAPTQGLTVAADWSKLPKFTWLYIEGVGIRRVEDTGSAIKQNRLDVAVDTHENALRWGGFGRHDVWVLAWGKSKK